MTEATNYGPVQRTVGYKTFLGYDVVTAARRRVAHLFDTFDTVSCMFSGGKDSLVVLELCLDEAERRGQLPLQTIFLDEELLPDSVIDYVDRWRQDPRIKLDWIAVPLKKERFILGRTIPLEAWDQTREFVRPMPPWAITRSDSDPVLFKQQEMDDWVVKKLRLRGKVCLTLGIRADESMQRTAAVMAKRHEPRIASSATSPRAKIGRPIYDWRENDVMKFLAETGTGWCPIYDVQALISSFLRVSTPLHHQAAKRMLPKLREMDPVFYARLQKIWPETDVQMRYAGESNPKANRDALVESGFDGIEAYIREKCRGAIREKALARMAMFVTRNRKFPEAYPVSHYVDQLLRGTFVPPLLPVVRSMQAKARQRKAAQ